LGRNLFVWALGSAQCCNLLHSHQTFSQTASWRLLSRRGSLADPTHRVAEDPKHGHDVEPKPSGEEVGPKNLGEEAYNALKAKNLNLVDAYEKDLLASDNSNQQGT